MKLKSLKRTGISPLESPCPCLPLNIRACPYPLNYMTRTASSTYLYNGSARFVSVDREYKHNAYQLVIMIQGARYLSCFYEDRPYYNLAMAFGDIAFPFEKREEAKKLDFHVILIASLYHSDNLPNGMYGFELWAGPNWEDRFGPLMWP